MSKRKVEVALRGQAFTVRSEKDEATIHALANFVGRKLDEISRHNQRRSPHELALLVALNIAEELFDAEDKSARLRRELRDRSERILARIDAALEATAVPLERPLEGPLHGNGDRGSGDQARGAATHGTAPNGAASNGAASNGAATNGDSADEVPVQSQAASLNRA